MNLDIPVDAPGGFAPLTALGWIDASGHCHPVAHDNGLPVAAARAASPEPLAGMAAGPQVVGPFVAVSDRPVYLTLSGNWQGEVRLMRSAPSSSVRHPLTFAGEEWGLFDRKLCEAVWQEGEEGAALWLELAPTAGNVTYRVAQ